MPQNVLAFDIGNTVTKIGYFFDGVLRETDNFPTEKQDFTLFREELTEQLTQLEQTKLDGIVVSSVVPDVLPVLEELVSVWPVKQPVFWLRREDLTDLRLDNLNIRDYQAKQLGTDRLANLIGAQYAYPQQNTLIVDIGTTVTLDMLAQDGQFLGGAICPGPKGFQSLVNPQHAAQLFEVDVFQAPQVTPGLSTQACLENGLYYGYKGMLLEVIGNLMQQSQWPLSQTTFVFTGGYASQTRALLLRELPNVHIDAGLTLSGLYQLWQSNRAMLAAV